MTAYRWLVLSHVKRPQSALWSQRRRVTVGSAPEWLSIGQFSSFPPHSRVLPPLLITFCCSGRLKQRLNSLLTGFSAPCGHSCWAVICLSAGATLTCCTKIRKRWAGVCVWPLSSAAGELIVQMQRARLNCAINQRDDSLPPYSRDL